MMRVTTTELIIFLMGIGGIALILWPNRGFYGRWRKAQRRSVPILREDALKAIHHWEMAGAFGTLEGVAGVLGINMNRTTLLLSEMVSDGLLVSPIPPLRLTPAGRDIALHIIRAHRLWERHLAEETGHPETDWHSLADEREHQLSIEDLAALSARLGHPTHDPHGDPIPREDGQVCLPVGLALTQLPLDTAAHIVHLEDEPEIVYAQLVAEGLSPGMPVRIVEKSANLIRFWTHGEEHCLAPLLAQNITVRPSVEEIEAGPTRRLSDLTLGETAVVTQLAESLRGAERRRFMDLGILPGTHITAEIRSPSGDPTGYRIRGAIIALRQQQANQIKIAAQNQKAIVKESIE